MQHFRETQKCSTTLRPDPLHQISLQSDNKCGKYVQKCIHACKYSAAFTAPLFTNLTIKKTHFCGHYCPKFCPKRTKIAAHPDKSSFTYFSTGWLSLPAPIFTKLAAAQLNYVGIFYTEFNPNGSVAVKSRVELHLRS